MKAIQHDFRRVFTTPAGGFIILAITLFFVLVHANPAQAITSKTISSGTTGGDCASIGTWNAATKTCTLTGDFAFSANGITINSDGITLDGAGHTITGSLGYSTAVSLALRNNVTVKNLTVKSFYYGIYALSSNGTNLIGNTFQGNTYGVYLDNSNTSKVYNNNFLSNTTAQAYAAGGSGNLFSQPVPKGGNFWSNFSTPAQGCSDNNGDGFCDAGFNFTGGSDTLPWAAQNGWGGAVPDTTAPTVSNVLPAGTTPFTSVTISAAYNDTGGSGINTASVAVYLDGTRMSGCTVSTSSVSCNVTGLANGGHGVSVSVADNAGNVGTGGSSFTVSVDTTPPVVTSVTPVGWINSTSATVNAIYTDSGSGINTASVKVYMDGTRLSGCNPTITGVSCVATGLVQGAHSISISVADNSGNVGTGTGSFQVDTAAPGVTGIMPAGTITVNSATISAYYSDAGSGINSATAAVYLDGSKSSGCVKTASSVGCAVSGLTNGTHNVTVFVSDNAGNSGTASGSFVVSVPDSTPPVVSNVQPSGTVTSSSATISASYSDTGSGINSASAAVYLDGSKLGGCTSTASSVSCNVNSLANGSHSITVFVRDNAGNAGTASGSFTVQVSAPKTITNNSTGGDCSTIGTWDASTKTCTLTGDLVFSGSNGIVISSDGITLDGAGHTITGSMGFTNGVTLSMRTNITIRNLTARSFTYGVYAISATNVTLTGNTFRGNAYGVDLDSSSTNKIYNNNFLSNTTAQALVEGGTGNLFSQPAPKGGNFWSNFSTPAQGCSDSNSDGFCDAAYNFSGGSDSLPLVNQSGLAPDTVAPVVSSIKPTGTLAAPTAAISAYYTDTGGSGVNTASVVVYLDGAAMSGCTVSPLSASCNAYGLVNGTHNVSVSVADNAGNVGTRSGSFAVSVDYTPPSVTNVTPFAWVKATTAIIQATYADSGSGVNSASAKVYVDGVKQSVCNATITGVNCTTTGLTQGAHSITVTVSDNAGNIGTGTGSFKVDSILPVAGVAAPAGIINSSSATVSAYYSDGGSGINSATAAVYLDGTAVSGCTVAASTASCNVYGLPQGWHSLTVRISDNAGNVGTGTGSFMVDTIAPAISSIRPTGWIRTTSAAVVAYYSDGGSGINSATAQVYVDGTQVSACAATASAATCSVYGLTEGGHSITVRVADNAGNIGSGFGSFQVDSVAPTVTGILPAGTTTANSAVISGYYADGGSGIDSATAAVYIDGSRIVTGCSTSTSAASCAVYGLTPGVHNIGVFVADIAGNLGRGSGTFIVDNGKPIISSILPSGWITSASAAISAYYLDSGSNINVATVAVYLDGIRQSGCAVTDSMATCNVYGLAQGSHSISVQVADNAGNLATGSGTFRVDTVSPNVTSIQPSGTLTSSSAAVYTYYSDTGSGINSASAAVYLDGNRLNDCTATAAAASCNVYGLAQGTHSLSVSVADNAGNIGTRTGSFLVDSGAPVISSMAPNGWINSTNATISAYYSDAGAGINLASAAVYLDGSVMSGCSVSTTSASCNAYGLAPGAHLISVTVADNVGNAASAFGAFQIDLQAPSLTGILPSGIITTGSATIKAYYSDADSGINSATAVVYLDGSKVNSCGVTASSASCYVYGLAQGAHSVSVFIADNAGNVSHGSGSFTIDSGGPAISSVQPGGWVRGTSAAISAYYSDSGSGVNAATAAVYLDGSRMSGCTAGATSASCNAYGLAQGAHSISVLVADNAGNVSTGSGSFAVDSVYPVVSSVLPTGTITSGSATISAYFSDAGSGIDSSSAAVYLDGNRLSGCVVTASSASCITNSMAQGAHAVNVVVADNAGNVGTGSGSFLVDTGGPVVSSITPGGWINTTSATVSAYYSDSGSGINLASAAVYLDGTRMTGCTVSATSASCNAYGLSQGIHWLSASVGDNVGNLGSGAGAFSVDSVSPAVTSVIPGGILTSGSAVISAYYSDSGSGINSATAAVYLDGTKMSGCIVSASTASCFANGLAQGAHTITVNIADNAGNVGAGSGSFSVDTSAPAVTSILPGGWINTTNAAVTAYYSDAVSGVNLASVEVYLDGAKMSGCAVGASSASCNAYGLTQGSHSVSVKVADSAGNAGAGSGAFSVDSTTPAVSDILPAGWVSTTSATISANYSDTGSGINSSSAAVYLDGSRMSGCTVTPSTVRCSVNSLAQGSHSLTVRVSDIAGNTGTGTGNFQVDSVAPLVTGILPAGNISSSSAVVYVYYSDAGSGINSASAIVYLDGNRLSGCAVTTSSASCSVYVTEGSHSIDGSVADNVGNVAKFSGTFTHAESGMPALDLGKPSPFWASSADYQDRLLSVSWTISNSGPINAYNVRITGSVNTDHVALVTPLPLAVADVVYRASSLTGTSSTFTLKYHVPPGVQFWNSLTIADATDAAGARYYYPQIAPTNSG